MNRLVIMIFEEPFIHFNDWEFIQEGAYLLWLNIYDSWVSPRSIVNRMENVHPDVRVLRVNGEQ